jgi:hypothetical protein
MMPLTSDEWDYPDDECQLQPLGSPDARKKLTRLARRAEEDASVSHSVVHVKDGVALTPIGERLLRDRKK